VNLNALNKKNLEAMAVAGAFDCFENIIRAQYFSLDTKGSSYIESLIRYGNNAKNVKNSSQQSLFGETGGFDMIKPEPTSCPDWPKLEKLNREKEVIGIYLSSHPLDDFKLAFFSAWNPRIDVVQDSERDNTYLAHFAPSVASGKGTVSRRLFKHRFRVVGQFRNDLIALDHDFFTNAVNVYAFVNCERFNRLHEYSRRKKTALKRLNWEGPFTPSAY
jgi:DNA polymerase III alpha subunit